VLKSRDGKTGRIKATLNIRTLRFEQAREPLAQDLWRNPAEPRELDE
jgi:hypothetical protein